MSSKSKLIINCAATHVSASQFSVSGGRLLLESFTTQELSYDYSAQEEWLPALKSALSSMKIKGNATVIAPSMLLLTKTIKVPHVSAENQREVVSVEVSKNIPYPLSELVWDYQVVADDGIETEIFLASVRAEDAACASTNILRMEEEFFRLYWICLDNMHGLPFCGAGRPRPDLL